MLIFVSSFEISRSNNNEQIFFYFQKIVYHLVCSLHTHTVKLKITTEKKELLRLRIKIEINV